jgi:hypothetical protein
MENNYKQIFIFTGITILLILVGYSSSIFSTLLLIAFVPLLILLKYAIIRNVSILNWSITLFLSLLITIIIISFIDDNSINVGLIIYPLGLSLVTSLYWIIKRNLKNSFGLFTLLILWLAFDYAILLVAPDLSQYFVFKALEQNASIITSSTGFMGTTLWGLSSNLLVVFVLFDPSAKNGVKFRWLSLIYVLILITAPLWIVAIWGSDVEGITWQQMYNSYIDSSSDNSTYLLNAEWLGRTSAWVAILLVIYSLVKLKIKK